MAARRMAAPSSSSGSPLEVKLVLQARRGPTNVLQPRRGPTRGRGGADVLLMTVLFHSPPQQNNGTCVTVAECGVCVTHACAGSALHRYM